MKSLREAIEQGELERFIADREGEEGDEAQFNATLQAMAGTSKEAPEASCAPPDGD